MDDDIDEKETFSKLLNTTSSTVNVTSTASSSSKGKTRNRKGRSSGKGSGQGSGGGTGYGYGVGIGNGDAASPPPPQPRSPLTPEMIREQKLKEKLHSWLYMIVARFAKGDTKPLPNEAMFVRDGKAEILIELTAKSDRKSVV